MEDRMARFRSRFLVLWLASVASVALVLPYALTLQRNVLEKLPVPLGVVALMSALQSAVLLAIAVFVGLRTADAVGLRTPLADAIAARTGVRGAFWALRPRSAAALGISVAVLIVALDALVFQPLMPEFRAAIATVAPSRIEGALASFYGGIAEEGPDPAVPRIGTRVDPAGARDVAGGDHRGAALRCWASAGRRGRRAA